jgi:hypothetical protein
MPNQTTFKYVTAYADAAPAVGLRERSLLFTHIPKTAGTTFEYILRAVALAQKMPLRRALGTIYGQFQGTGKGEAMMEFGHWPEEALHTHAYMSGHLPYGMHRVMKHPCFYITMLRDPAARLLSQYRFGMQRGGWDESVSISEVIRKGLLADNLQTRMIAGLGNCANPCNADTLKTAIHHLRSEYAIVGITERLDDMLKVLITLLGWPDIVYGNRQVTANAPTPAQQEQAQKAARRFFAYDLELYSVARELAETNAARVLKGNPHGSKRQREVIACIPDTAEDGSEKALMSWKDFDQHILPMLHAQGGDVVFV